MRSDFIRGIFVRLEGRRRGVVHEFSPAFLWGNRVFGHYLDNVGFRILNPTYKIGRSHFERGDRACLSLSLKLSLPSLTTDHAWASLGLNLDVCVIR